MIRSRKSALTAFATFAAASAALVLAAPDASAYVSSVNISSGSSIGGGYGTTCSYTVTVNGSPYEYVWLYDSNTATFGTQQFSLGSGGTGTSSWTPSSTGVHFVQAWSYNGSQFAVVTVRTGINLGSACIVTG
ncbi:hypothetical protein [Nocardia seriolae]|uniref:Ig-like domain-containing protein n=1 Tax=Nocardia seriolae TaxID=37332 RepID=A0A0B8N5Z3_9NOCA|nr:hypothetical protein [Nocardia seriolae]APA98850.1 hypothetical protein NS506_04804 [Nocardia seriolae]MTJ63563.1 hypothetical protein [Nocardia seriolae]MTJ72453.1 hypothetical protein [Nocardia seriolae]MTJ88479.1 hypothetical protein [Nocardia seriolae]MTK32461.1 hypothetical protein [Nocardia seriolae]